MKKITLSIKAALAGAFILLGIFGFSASANAQWNLTSVIGYNILSLTASGNNVYAGTDGNGVYLSTDAGANWTSIRNGFPQYSTPSVNCVAVSGSNLFAGTVGLGVYYSNNNGTSWTSVANGAMAVNATTNSIAISGTNVFAADDDGVYLTSDNGNSWTLLTGSFAPSSLVIKGSNIFAGVGQGSVYLSGNNGVTWTAINSGLPSNNVAPVALAFSGNNLFMGTVGSGVYLTSNNGSSWAPVDKGRLANNSAYSIATNGNVIFAGSYGSVYYSINTGKSWSEIDSGALPYNGSVTALAVSGNNLLAGVSGNIEAGVWIYNASHIFAGVNKITAAEDNINIYPNPATSQITIDLTNISGTIESIAIYDMSGRILTTQNYAEGVRNAVETIDVSNFATGMYLVETTTSNGRFCEKVCKN